MIDLFAEIETAYGGKESIFDRITKDDLILAFFPCVRFENQIMLAFRGAISWYGKMEFTAEDGARHETVKRSQIYV